MRHKKTTAKLGKKAAPRKALLRGLATSLVLKGKIQITLARAKVLRSVVEKQITLAKKDTLAAKRQIMEYIYDEKAVKILMKELGPKYKTRKGGYTRIIKLENRKGDNAPTAIIEFV
jgi:large subunit ribosomal protein L17